MSFFSQVNSGKINQLNASLADRTTDLQQRAINVLHPPAPLVAAKMDGITDDSDAIQAIIDYVYGLGGGTVYIPQGTVGVVPKIRSSYSTTNKVALWARDKVSIIGSGVNSVFKALNNVGTFASLISSNGGYTNATLKDFVIDQNVANNQSSPVIGDATQTCYSIYLTGINKVTIDNVHANTSKGINTFYLSGSKFTVKNCYINFLMPNVTEYDNSAIYAVGYDYEIIDNIIETASVDSAHKARGGFELHGGPCTARNNTVRNFMNGCNVVNNNYTYDLSMDIHDNHFVNVGQGVVLWPYASTGNLTGIKIHDNIIQIQQSAFNLISMCGVGTNYDASQSYSSMQRIDIYNNLITFQDDSVISSPSLSSNCGGVILWTKADIQQVNIKNNMIVNAPLVGIYFYHGIGNAPAYPASNCVIQGNHIMNAGWSTRTTSSLVYNRSAIYIANAIVNMFIRDNIIEDNSNPFKGSAAFYCGAVTSATNLIFKGNQWSTSQGGYLLSREYKYGDKATSVTPIAGITDLDEDFNLYSNGLPTSGDFTIKQNVINTNNTIGMPSSWKVTTKGTIDTNPTGITATADPSNPTTSIILSDSTAFRVGNYILLSGGNLSLIYRLNGNNAYIAGGVPGSGSPWNITFQAPVLSPSGQIGYRTNAGSPISVLTPNFIKEEVLDTTNNKWYKSVGLTNGFWVALN